jgi:hypothetical protein
MTPSKKHPMPGAARAAALRGPAWCWPSKRKLKLDKNAIGQLPIDFIDHNGRRVLTDFGRPGMDGRDGVGSTTESTLATIASILFNEGPRLDSQQFDVVERWIAMCRPR